MSQTHVWWAHLCGQFTEHPNFSKEGKHYIGFGSGSQTKNFTRTCLYFYFYFYRYRWLGLVISIVLKFIYSNFSNTHGYQIHPQVTIHKSTITGQQIFSCIMTTRQAGVNRENNYVANWFVNLLELKVQVDNSLWYTEHKLILVPLTDDQLPKTTRPLWSFSILILYGSAIFVL